MAGKRRTLEQLQRAMKQRDPEPRPGRGRPRLKINPEIIIYLAGCGYTVPEIAEKICCDPKTLRTRFSPELAIGQARFLDGLKRAGLDLPEANNMPQLVRLRSAAWQLLRPRHFLGPKKPKKYARKRRRTDSPPPAPAAPAAPAPAAQDPNEGKPWAIVEFAL